MTAGRENARVNLLLAADFVRDGAIKLFMADHAARPVCLTLTEERCAS